MVTENLLILAKNGHKDSMEKIINNYYPFIIKETKGIFLDSYVFEDLVQTGIESILKGINKFDLDKGVDKFSPYIFLCIKNNFNYLCRKEIRNNNSLSLNAVIKDNMESIDFLESNQTLEEIVFQNLKSKELSLALKFLNHEELDLVTFLYLSTPNGKKQLLSQYAKIREKDYYYCTSLKKRTLQKLKNSIIIS